MMGIEYVCMGNLDRSPLAEAIARKYYPERGYADMAVSSSGTLVEQINAVPESSPMVEEIRRLARERGYQGNDFLEAQNVLVAWSEQQKKALAERHGLTFKKGRQQTKVIPGSLLLTFGEANKKRALTLYGETPARIFTLDEYVGEDLSSVLPNPFGKDAAVYGQLYQTLARVVPRSVEKAREEHGLL